MRIACGILAVVSAGVVACTAAGARADDFPKRKPGLWQIAMNMGTPNRPAQSMQFCIDAATDAALYKFGMNAAQGMCSRNDIHTTGGIVTVDSVCKLGETKMTSHSVMTFTGDAAYRSETKTQFEPPMMGRGESTMTQEAKWTGPCPADMQPGDLIGPNGMKMNLKSMTTQP